TRAGVAALAFGTLGAYLIVARGLVPDLSGPAGPQRIVGDLLVILSLAFEAGYSIRGKGVLDRWPPLFTVSLTLTASLIIWIPAGVISVWHGGLPSLSLPGWAGVLYMALFATVLGYWLWFRGLSRLGGAEAAPLLFLQPLVGTVIAVLLLHEQLTWATILGGLLILGSLLMVVRAEPVAPGSVPEAIGESVP
ncbi:MAG TPA: DMT family transporter, partial [Ktedonobacterales bacterium]